MIPGDAHFVWIGRSLPFTHLVALRSAVAAGGFERVFFHHTDDLAGCRFWPALTARAGVIARRLSPRELFAGHRRQDALAQLYERLEQPAAKSNLLRVALLRRYGGVYLDLDTVTVRPLSDLRQKYDFFCGEEVLVFPERLRALPDPLGYAAALCRHGVRDVLRRLPDGWRTFRRIEHHYPRAVNNAIVGAAAGHPNLDRLLSGMLALPEKEQLVRYALGTSLFQRLVPTFEHAASTLVLPPRAFYPLGPEISQHWFRERERADVRDVLGKDTRVVHWYASVRTRRVVSRIDPDYVRARADRQWFSQLALPHVA